MKSKHYNDNIKLQFKWLFYYTINVFVKLLILTFKVEFRFRPYSNKKKDLNGPIIRFLYAKICFVIILIWGEIWFQTCSWHCWMVRNFWKSCNFCQKHECKCQISELRSHKQICLFNFLPRLHKFVLRQDFPL